MTVALRRFILLDVSSCATGVVVTVFVYAVISRAGAVVGLGLAVLAAGALIASGLRSLERGDLTGAVDRVAVANWTVTLFAAAVATFTWPVEVVAAFIPAVLASPYVSPGRQRAYVAISFAVSLAVVAAGLLQDVTELTSEIPRWFQQGVLIGFTPFVAAMIALLARQSNELTRAALGRVAEANEQLTSQAEALRHSRARVVAATDRERRRIERNIHDGAQQQLVGIDLRLAAARELVVRDGPTAERALAEAQAMVQHAHAELRALGQGIFPPVLATQGLAAALDSAADRSPNAVATSLSRVGRHAPEAEAAVYFCCVEALQNSTKHAGPGAKLHLALTERDGRLHFEVTDDGPGLVASDRPIGNGHANMRDRIGAVGGEITVGPNRPNGTRIAGWVPASPRPQQSRPAG